MCIRKRIEGSNPSLTATNSEARDDNRLGFFRFRYGQAPEGVDENPRRVRFRGSLRPENGAAHPDPPPLIRSNPQNRSR